MQRPIALVTGAGGEMGRLLVPALAARGYSVVALDLGPLPETITAVCQEAITADITDGSAMSDLWQRVAPDAVFHLAALLSRHAERDPDRAHRVNVEATLHLMRLGRERAARGGAAVPFLFPSSIAVYGLPDADAKTAAGAVSETEWTTPTAIYGCNKLYAEMVGTYWAARAEREGTPGIDFRALRFPGMISADSVPSGGTSDYLPEMVHAAAAGIPYACFVREDTRLPFMTMPDAVEAFLTLAAANARKLTRRSYNLRGFSPTAGEFYQELRRHLPGAVVTFQPDRARQALVDTWPADVDDSRARQDWGLSPAHGLAKALGSYLVPALSGRSPQADSVLGGRNPEL